MISSIYQKKKKMLDKDDQTNICLLNNTYCSPKLKSRSALFLELCGFMLSMMKYDKHLFI